MAAGSERVPFVDCGYGRTLFAACPVDKRMLTVAASCVLHVIMPADTASDYQLKTGLLHDMLTIVDVEAKLTGKETQVRRWCYVKPSLP